MTKRINITLSDEAHEQLLKIKKELQLHNLDETINLILLNS